MHFPMWRARFSSASDSLGGVAILRLRTQFLLFVMAILLILIFWELRKIHARLKKALRAEKESAKRREETGNIK